MRIVAAGILAFGCACSAPAEPPAAPAPPNGARVEKSGFFTVDQAPPSAPGAPAPRGPKDEQTFYAQLAGVSNEEAAKRLKQQDAVRPEFERLLTQLRAKERGNFTEAELIHRPDWSFLLYFKRDPKKTLAKYTKNPRFQARSAPYTHEELEKLSAPWIERLEKERLFTGYGMNARNGRAELDMVVSQEEFAAIAARNGWGPVPDYIQLKFEGAPVGPAIDEAVVPGIRIFPQGDRNLGITHQMAISGRIVLRDGCFYVVSPVGSEPAKLAYFPREVGLYVDPQGYLALRTRAEPSRHLGRIGEQFTWAGPIHLPETAPKVRELRERCGNAPLMHGAIPESSAMFNARYGLPRTPPPPPPRPEAWRQAN